MHYKIQRRHLQGFIVWIDQVGNLNVDDSCRRTDFADMLRDEFNKFEEERGELIAEYSEKDEKGNIIVTDRNEQEDTAKVKLKEEKMEEFKQKQLALLDGDIEILITNENKELFRFMKDFVLKTGYIFGPRDGMSTPDKYREIEMAKGFAAWARTFRNLDIT